MCGSVIHRATWRRSAVVLAMLAAFGAQAQEDALSLESAPAEPVQATRHTKMSLEASLGNNSQRNSLMSTDVRRASFDLLYSDKVAPNWRAVLSNRLDAIHPAVAGDDATINSLREAYLSWQPGTGDTVFDLGRINVRSGPGYGYNPTDFFRDGSLRVLTSADPFALRQNRLGTVLLRAQRLWSDGSLSLAYSPKLADAPSRDGLNLDLGSTNNRDRVLMTLGTQWSQRLNSQFLLYKDDNQSATLGANLTALLSDAATAHLEWTHGSEADLQSRALGLATATVTRHRLVGGVTYTTLGKTSITAEYHYNGFGLNQAGWAVLGATPGAQLSYLNAALRLQELAPQQAYLIYVTQKGLGLKDLDLTAYLRFNPGDDSKLAWLELRHRWAKYDLSLQWQQNMGSPSSEFGVLPEARLIQVLGNYYF